MEVAGSDFHHMALLGCELVSNDDDKVDESSLDELQVRHQRRARPCTRVLGRLGCRIRTSSSVPGLGRAAVP